jgi:hypothetical protein
VAVDQAAELGFDVAVAVGGRAVGCGEAVHVLGLARERTAAVWQGLDGLLVSANSVRAAEFKENTIAGGEDNTLKSRQVMDAEESNRAKSRVNTNRQ